MLGPLHYGDLILIVLALISGMLALYRGLTREVLSLVSWGAAAGATYVFIQSQKELTTELAANFGVPAIVTQVGLGALVFLVVLIVVHLVTVRISDAILDRQLGMVDRILGFLFGVARAYLLVVIPYMLYESFFPKPEQQWEWVSKSYSIEYVRSTSSSLTQILLPFAEQWSGDSVDGVDDEPKQEGQIRLNQTLQFAAALSSSTPDVIGRAQANGPRVVVNFKPGQIN